MTPELLALKHKSRIVGNLSDSVCGFSIMEQVRLCAVWPMENWLGSSLNQIQGWTTVRESYSCALEQGPMHDTLYRRQKGSRAAGGSKQRSENISQYSDRIIRTARSRSPRRTAISGRR